MKTYTAWIFLIEGGSKLWKTDEERLSNKEILEQYLAPNGFHGRVTDVKGGVLYYEVDPQVMNMKDFYTWTDFLSVGKVPSTDMDIWRPFLWVGETPGKEDEYVWRAEVKAAGKLAFLDDFWSVCGTAQEPK